MDIKKKDLLILSYLRKNSRISLTKMSRKTGIPISTLYDKIQSQKGKIIKKFTSIIDFKKLGYEIKANILIKTHFYDIEKIQSFLEKCFHVNNLQVINNHYNFFIEGVFKNIQELEEFKKKLFEKGKIEAIDIYFIVDEIKKEKLLEETEIIETMI